MPARGCTQGYTQHHLAAAGEKATTQPTVTKYSNHRPKSVSHNSHTRGLRPTVMDTPPDSHSEGKVDPKGCGKAESESENEHERS